MNKMYMEPSMKVYELKNRTHLLAGSGEASPEPEEYLEGPVGYAPGIGEDAQQLVLDSVG